MKWVPSNGGVSMSKSVWRLTVRSEFCAAHALRHYKGKCERLHGHNYGVEVTVEGSDLSADTELLMDFGELKALVKTALEDLDHTLLNDMPPFDRITPSSENIARHVWQILAPQLPGHVRLTAVTIAEKGVQSATYQELS